MEQEKKAVEKVQGCGCGCDGGESEKNPISCCGGNSINSKLSYTVKTAIYLVVVLAAISVAFILKK